MRLFFRVIQGEVKAISHDSGALLILIGATVIYSFFYPTPYLNEVLKEVPIAVVDLDGSALSRRLIRMTDAHELVRVARKAPSQSEAETWVLDGSVNGILSMPRDFEKDVLRGEPAHVGLYADASYFLVYRQVLTGILEAVGTLSGGIEIRRLEAQGVPEEKAVKMREPLPGTTRPLFNPTEGYASYIVPSVLILLLQQTLLIGIGLVSGTRREKGAVAVKGWSESLAAVLGRGLVYFVLSLGTSAFVFLVAYRIYGFRETANTSRLLMVLVPFLLASVLLALTLSPFFRQRESALQFLLLASLPAIFLAQFSWPSEALPTWLRQASFLLPTTQAIPAFLRINGMDSTLAQVHSEWKSLWILCGLYLSASIVAHKVTGRVTVAADEEVT